MSIINYAICEQCNQAIDLGKASLLYELQPASIALPNNRTLIKDRIDEIFQAGRLEKDYIVPMLQIVAFLLLHNGHHVRVEAEGGTFLEGVGLADDNEHIRDRIYGKFEAIE